MIDISRNYLYIESDLQKKIAKKNILIIGAGLGSYIAEALLRIGFENIIIADGDCVEESNLNRQNYENEDITKNKALALRKRIKRIDENNHIAFIPFYLKKESLYKWIISADIVINTIDFDTKEFLLCNEIAAQTGRIVIFPLNLGFAGVNYIFYPESPNLKDFFQKKKAADIKEALITHTLKELTDRESVPDWLLSAYTNYMRRKREYDPQMIPATLNVASMVTASCVAISRQQKLKNFPRVIFQDSYGNALANAYDIKERGKETSICLYNPDTDFSLWELGKDKFDEFIDFVWKVYIESYEEKYKKKWPYDKKEKIKMKEEEEEYFPISRIYAVLNNDGQIVGTSRVIRSNLMDKTELPITKEYGIRKEDLYYKFDVHPLEGDIFDAGRSAIDKKLLEERNKRGDAKHILSHLVKQFVVEVRSNDNNIMVGEPSVLYKRILKSMGLVFIELAEPKEYMGIDCVPCANTVKEGRIELKKRFPLYYNFYMHSRV
ncbi:MAG: ThiF family adenylyltransferase [Spirochaetia bacterium]|nr:ThiF family adenylyltransferase [Spirochaetia bacterium]